MAKARLSVAFLLLLWALPAMAAAEKRLPIFDAHMHYSHGAWDMFPPAAVVGKMDAAGVPRALVSSTPDDGTLTLFRRDAGRFVPELRPYRTGVTLTNWFRDPGVPDYLAERLKRGVYRGIGEFHLFDETEARTPQLRRVIALAVEYDILLHVHTGAAPVLALFAVEPKLKILWAHAGMSTPPELIGKLLDRHQRLWAELSFRAGDIAEDDTVAPAWRALFERHPDRFMIGTDTYRAFRWDVYAELVDEHRAWLDLLPRELAEAVAYRNAVRLFGAGGRKALTE